MKCEHETSQIIPIRSSLESYGDEIIIKVKDRCEFCRKINNIINEELK
jgi:hypothetical protein